MNVKRYGELLKESGYDAEETDFLLDGFNNGFDIGYRGEARRQSQARNIPFTVGNKYILWEKIMKEVKEKRYAGPYETIPFDNYVQSPVGLVLKQGNKTRLIFHLSYCFSEDPKDSSINAATPKEWCTVHYNNLDTAIKQCLLVSEQAYINFNSKTIVLGKTDLSSAFRVLPLKVSCFCWLVLKAEDPRDGKIKYFIDKCLPFRASISCSHYQRFSNSLKHLISHRTGHKEITNYLDDFLFIAMLKWICDHIIGEFLEMCKELCIPVASEKTEWGATCLIFLGILLDGRQLVLCVPLEKREKAINMLKLIVSKKKAMIKELQVLTRYLNFLGRAIVPGRTFTRRMYAKCGQTTATGKKLKQHHHIMLDKEFKLDAELWLHFLVNHRDASVCRPMIDLESKSISARQLKFYSDASASKILGFGAVFNSHWLFGKWPNNFIEDNEPSIEYLELFALVAAVITWEKLTQNIWMIVYCDNQSVVEMINSQVSRCKNCMYLLIVLILNNMVSNRRVFATHLRSEENYLSDALSRMQFRRFWRLAPPNMDLVPTAVTELLWPITKVWQKH